MKPIGPLMREHRLIERMVGVLNRQVLGYGKGVDTSLISVAVDFFRTYADRTHHGKEEDILFKELAEKQLSENHRKMIGELIKEHAYARQKVTALSEANTMYRVDKTGSPENIIKLVKDLVSFYPIHIAKEDKEFFYPCLEYLSRGEQDKMLQEFWEFDRKLIHEKYVSVVENVEKNIQS